MFMLLPLLEKNEKTFIKDMMDAFQDGTEKEYGKINETILPEKEIELSIKNEHSAAYQAMINRELVGGAIVVIDKEKKHNYLEFLYVKKEYQGKDIGRRIWHTLEGLYPETVVWETVTPYFEKRNLHFYINVCGFHAVEFYNPQYKGAYEPANIPGGDYFFRFVKQMS